jgi:CubicO group peptidase (beta-lactamase class C family)
MINRIASSFRITSLVAILCAVPIALAQTDGPLQIAPAIELKFTTTQHSFAALLASDDLSTRRELRTEFTPSQEERSVLLPSSDKAKFYKHENQTISNLAAMLEPVRAQHNLPAMSAVVVLSNRVVGIGAVGLRKVGATETVTIHDKWHIGSCTKSVTATLAAMLVADGLIQWNSTIAGIFPEYSSLMHSQWRHVTLEWLVQNRGGAPNAVPSAIWSQMWDFPGSPRDARIHMMTNMTKAAPAATPGITNIYSNTGFAIAGAMLEKVSGRPWEELVRDRIFKPLGLTSGGFGVPATPRYMNEPWGHILQNEVMTPVQPGIDADNPTGNAPAGAIHMSLMDQAKYCMLHINAAKGRSDLLSTAAATKLHTPPDGQDYAMGWIAVPRPWAHGNTLTHAGSNTQWYTIIWIAPAREFAVVVNTNFGGDTAAPATDAVVGSIIKSFLQ